MKSIKYHYVEASKAFKAQDQIGLNTGVGKTVQANETVVVIQSSQYQHTPIFLGMLSELDPVQS